MYLVHEDDLLRRLHDLDREQAHQHETRHTRRETERRWIVDTALVERLEHAGRGPWLVRRRSRDHLLRAEARGRVRILPCAPHAEPVVGVFPLARTAAAALPDTGEIRLAVSGARNGRLRSGRWRGPRRRLGPDCHRREGNGDATTRAARITAPSRLARRRRHQSRPADRRTACCHRQTSLRGNAPVFRRDGHATRTR